MLPIPSSHIGCSNIVSGGEWSATKVYPSIPCSTVCCLSYSEWLFTLSTDFELDNQRVPPQLRAHSSILVLKVHRKRLRIPSPEVIPMAIGLIQTASHGDIIWNQVWAGIMVWELEVPKQTRGMLLGCLHIIKVNNHCILQLLHLCYPCCPFYEMLLCLSHQQLLLICIRYQNSISYCTFGSEI